MNSHTFKWFNINLTSFWQAQSVGFAFYAVFDFMRYLLMNGYSHELVVSLGVHLFNLFWITSLLRLVYKRTDINQFTFTRLIPRVELSSLCAAALLLLLNTIITRAALEGNMEAIYNHFQKARSSAVFWNIFLYNILFLSWSSLYFIIKVWRFWENQHQQTLKAEALIQQAQLQMLRYRLNPHFLFNTLNAIRVLVSEDKYSARQMITELSEFLRYSLVSRKQQTVELDEELQAVTRYLNIAKQRYEEKVIISFSIQEDTRRESVISFMLPPIVENALKYGLRTSSLPLHIELQTRKENEILVIEIKNSGYWVPPVQKDNLFAQGLTNVRQRLKNVYGSQAKLTIQQEQNWVIIRIEIMNQDVNNDQKTV